MARSYSLDLREKVMSYITSGGQKREAAKIFKIGEDTIYRWLRKQKTGDLSPKKRVDFPRKMDPKKLSEYVEKYPDHTLKEIAAALNLAFQTVSSWLRRLGITRKKRPRCTKNEMQRSALNFKKT